MQDFCANLTRISLDVLDTFHTLPVLVECSRSTRLPSSQKKEVETKLQTRAESKIGALQQLALWWQKHLKSQSSRPVGNPFVTELLGVCQKFHQGVPANPGGWPDDIWNMARKWPDYYKHDLFWSLMDAIELFASSEDEWTAHVLCLSALERARDDVQPRVSMNGRFQVVSLELEYLWKLDQETTIKEKDEVLIREDPSLKGKVIKIENFGAGQTSRVVLLFDTNFKRNANLMNLLQPGLSRISIMQAKFALQNGATGLNLCNPLWMSFLWLSFFVRFTFLLFHVVSVSSSSSFCDTKLGIQDNIMTRAVEQELGEITRLPWQYLQPSFRHFLLRRAVSSSPITEANAEEQVKNLQENYMIIQGPPGTGKTKLVSRALSFASLYAFMLQLEKVVVNIFFTH